MMMMMASLCNREIAAKDLEANLIDTSPPPNTSTYTHIPEAASLTWTNSFYDDKPGVIAAFDHEADAAGRWVLFRGLLSACVFYLAGFFYGVVGFMGLVQTKTDEEGVVNRFICADMLIVGTIALFMGFRSRKAMHSQQVAITTEGVRIDSGDAFSTTIPFEQILTAHVQVEKVYLWKARFQTIAIHRNAAPMERSCWTRKVKVELHGIVNAKEFVALLEAMKHSQGYAPSYLHAKARTEVVKRGAVTKKS